MRAQIWSIAAAIAVLAIAGSAMAQDARSIRIRLGDRAVVATLNDSEAARDLLAMLPLSIRMRDHLEREKTGPLSGPLSERTPGKADYLKGDLGYWRPGGNFVIFYRHDTLAIPPPGIVILGTVDSGVELFDVPGPVEVTVERAK